MTITSNGAILQRTIISDGVMFIFRQVVIDSAFPSDPKQQVLYIVGSVMKYWNGSAWVALGGGSAIWGGITGTLSAQTDLQNALNLKANANNVLALNQTTPQTISNGTPLLNRTVAEITDPKHIITKEYLDARTRGGGGFLANLYFRSDNSDISGYKRIDYINEATETELTGTVKASDGTKLLRTYIFDDAIGATILDAGIYVANYRVKLSSASGVTQMVFTAFVRHIDNTETDLFTAESVEINNTDFANIRSEYNAPSYNVVATDRFGVRIQAKTTHASNITITTVIGDGYGSYFSTPVAIRHELLRGRTEADQHPIAAITDLASTLSGKQATLVSGSNIKTINSQSILGSGDIIISGGLDKTFQTLTEAATITFDAATSVNGSVTLTDSRIGGNITNAVVGEVHCWKIIQGGAGGYAMTWGNQYKFSGGVLPILSATVGAVDLLFFLAVSATEFHFINANFDVKTP